MKSQNIFTVYVILLFKTIELIFVAYQRFNGQFVQVLNNDDMNARIGQFSYISLYQPLISLYIYNFFVRCKHDTICLNLAKTDYCKFIEKKVLKRDGDGMKTELCLQMC